MAEKWWRRSNLEKLEHNRAIILALYDALAEQREQNRLLIIRCEAEKENLRMKIKEATRSLARRAELMGKAQAVLDRLHQKTDCLDDEAVNLIDELAAEFDGFPRGG